MKAGLQQAYAGHLLPCGAIKNILHQAPPHAAVLSCRVDGNRSERNGGSFVKEITANDAAFALGDDRVEARMGQQHRRQPARYFRRGKVRREVMLRADRLESLIANAAAGRGVGCRARTKNDSHLSVAPFAGAASVRALIM